MSIMNNHKNDTNRISGAGELLEAEGISLVL